MRLLGLDPGLRQTGWGIVDHDGFRLRYVACGTVRPNPQTPIATRLADLYEALADVISNWQPQSAAVEETFVNKNASSTLKLGLARGVVLLVPALSGLDVVEYHNRSVKRTVVGTGRAAKEQIAMMVRKLLPGCDPDSDDAADALAVAICHAHHQGARAAIAQGTRNAATVAS